MNLRTLRTVPILSAGVLALALAGCTAPSASSTSTPTPTATAWSYDGSNGSAPDHWDEVAAECANTSESHESPIDIETSTMKTDSSVQAVKVNYTSTSFSVENNGHTIEAVPADLKANSIELNGTTYYLQQFHFHAESENTIDGKHTAAELHLVNKSDKGEVVVLALMLQTGEENAPLNELFEHIPAKQTAEGQDVELESPIDLAALIPAGSVSAQFDGSLTTPPCSQGVRWNVYLTPVTVSSEQLSAFTAVYPDNHRPLQPLNGREIAKVAAQ